MVGERSLLPLAYRTAVAAGTLPHETPAGQWNVAGSDGKNFKRQPAITAAKGKGCAKSALCDRACVWAACVAVAARPAPGSCVESGFSARSDPLRFGNLKSASLRALSLTAQFLTDTGS